MSQPFFWIRAIDHRNSPRAVSFGPLPEMPFFEGLSQYRKMCDDYWKVNPEAPGMDIDTVGSEWSDLIYCSSSPSRFFVSQRIVDSLERERIPILRKTVMPIAKIRSKRLRELPPPTYYVLEAIPSLAVDWSAMGVGSDPESRARWMPTKKQPSTIFDRSSWTGLDLFSLSNHMAAVTLYCTERLKQLAEKEKWTNIEFEPVGQSSPEA